MPSFNISNLKECAPKAWKDFTAFFEEEVQELQYMKGVSFEELPFELQVGFFIKYFNNNGVEPDVIDFQMENLITSIEECFLNFENVIGHYS